MKTNSVLLKKLSEDELISYLDSFKNDHKSLENAANSLKGIPLSDKVLYWFLYIKRYTPCITILNNNNHIKDEHINELCVKTPIVAMNLFYNSLNERNIITLELSSPHQTRILLQNHPVYLEMLNKRDNKQNQDGFSS